MYVCVCVCVMQNPGAGIETSHTATNTISTQLQFTDRLLSVDDLVHTTTTPHPHSLTGCVRAVDVVVGSAKTGPRLAGIVPPAIASGVIQPTASSWAQSLTQRLRVSQGCIPVVGSVTYLAL